MSFTKVILEAEHTAKELLEHAEQKSRSEIEEHKKNKDHQLSELKEELLQKRTNQIKKQKNDLVTLYKSIVDEGKIRAAEVETKAAKRKDQAVQMILQRMYD